ncbi:MAG: hypothetical protein ACI9D0_001101 [Bacteroidia bacterium]|jgi:hypothetical protein
MTPLILRLLLFAIAALAIVTMAAFYAEADDTAALKSIPRRFIRFYLACALLTVIVWAMGAFMA